MIYALLSVAVFAFFCWCGFTGPDAKRLRGKGEMSPVVLVACAAVLGVLWWLSIPWLLLALYHEIPRRRRLKRAIAELERFAAKYAEPPSSATLDLLTEQSGAHPVIAKARREAGLPSRAANQA